MLVRIQLLPHKGPLAQFGRAVVLQATGCPFESGRVHAHAEVGHAGEPLDLGSGAGGFDSRPRYLRWLRSLSFLARAAYPPS